MVNYCKTCIWENGTSEICDCCNYSGLAEEYGIPPTGYEKKNQTNADRIRAMTDEELAGLFADMRQEHWCPPDGGDCKEYCSDCWLDWLKKEAT